MSTREEKIQQLFQIFGGSKLSRADVENFLDANNGNFDRTVDALLNYKPTTDRREQFKSPEETQRQKNLETVHNMFGGDLTHSVISAVYLQNQGDLVQTVDTLLNISHDEEAIEAIRNMNAQQKEKLEEDMKKEQEKRLNERKERLQMEIVDERQRLADLERKLMDEEARHERAMQEKIDRFSQNVKEEEIRQKELEELEKKKKKRRQEMSKLPPYAKKSNVSRRTKSKKYKKGKKILLTKNFWFPKSCNKQRCVLYRSVMASKQWWSAGP